MLLRFWEAVSSIGLTDDLSFTNKSQVKIINRVVVVLSLVVLTYLLLNYFLWNEPLTQHQFNWYIAINVVTALIFIPVLLLNHFHWYRTGQFLLVMTVFFLFFLNSFNLQKPFRTELYFFCLAAFTFIMFTDMRMVIFLFILQAIAYYVTAREILLANPVFGEPNTGLAIRILIAFSFLFFILYFKQEQTDRYQEEIEIKNSELLNEHEELQKINYTKDKIFSIISHDLRSPIASLRSLLTLISNEHIGQEDFKKATAGLEKQVIQLSSSLDELLTWAKAQLHGINPAPEMVFIRPLIVQIATVHKVSARHKKIIITTNIPSELTAYCDPNMLQSVITNLLSNAIKFTPVGGAISISADEVDHQVHIQIEDTGVGIQPQNISKILNPSVLFTTRGTNNEKGTGLGLAMCVEFIQKNNGTFDIRSEDGKGTCFTITLPTQKQ